MAVVWKAVMPWPVAFRPIEVKARDRIFVEGLQHEDGIQLTSYTVERDEGLIKRAICQKVDTRHLMSRSVFVAPKRNHYSCHVGNLVKYWSGREFERLRQVNEANF
jgi:hypothetical protein